MALSLAVLRHSIAVSLLLAFLGEGAPDTASLLQRPDIPAKKDKEDEPQQGKSEPFLIGLRRESVPIYRRGRVASFKTSYSGVLSVGSPAQHFRVVFDTGSGNIVLPAVECKTEACLVEGRRRFNMSASSTAVAVNTDGSPVPEGEASDQVTIGFGTGEITGEFTRDTVCFGSPKAHSTLVAEEEAAAKKAAAAAAAAAAANATASGENASAESTAPPAESTGPPAEVAAPPAEVQAEAQAEAPEGGADGAEASTEVALADDSAGAEVDESNELCVEMNVVLAVEMSTQPFKTFRFDGILGLGLDGLAMSKQFSAFEMIFGTGLPEAHFGVFLTEGEDGEESEIAMGGHDSRRILHPLAFSPVVMPEFGYWQVQIVAVRINGVELEVCKDGTCRGVVDTGTSHLGIPAPADAEVADLLTTEAEDLLDCRLAEAPVMEIEVAGFNLTLHPFNYMRRLPLREGVSVSSAQGVYVPSNETNATLVAPSSADPVGNASGAALQEAAARYARTAAGEYCPEGRDLAAEDDCRAAAAGLGLEFAHSWEGPGDHRYCLFADDGRSRVYWNVAGDRAAPVPPNPQYSSLCVQAQQEAPPPAAPAAAPVEVEEAVRRFCRPRLMPVRLPAPLGPKLFILGEPVLHRYYTVYDWAHHRVGFSLANSRRNTMDPAELTDRRGSLPKEVDVLLMQKSVKISKGQDVAASAAASLADEVILVQVQVKVTLRRRA